MNVGIITTWFERGAAIVSRAYRDTLVTQHQVYIYARGGEQQGKGDSKWDQEYVTWSELVLPQFSTYVDWQHFRQWIAHNQIKLLIFNEQISWDVILRCLRLPLVLGAYVDYYTHRTIPFFQLYDFLLCNTKRHYGLFRSHPQALYLPWGTDCTLFQPQPSLSPPGTVTFFHSAGMGGIRLRKGTDLLVQAFQQVRGNARLVIHAQVGLATFAPCAQLIQDDSRITFIEKTVPAPGLYHLGDVYVYPTRLEGIGLTIIEALACGLPVITTNAAPMNEFVLDGMTGKLVAVERRQERPDGYYWPEGICSIPALTAAMQFYVDNPAEISKQQQRARAHALEHLDWARNSQELGKVVAQFARLEKPRSLRVAAGKYERAQLAEGHIAAAFAAHQRGQFQDVVRHLAAGLSRNPAWLRDRGVWSIGFRALLRQRPPESYQATSEPR